MSLALWEPLRSIDTLDRLVDDFFGRRADLAGALTAGRAGAERVWRPAADLLADESGYKFHFDLPGVSKENIEIDVSDGVLTVRGKREDVVENKNEDVYRRETFRGVFERSFRLPADADATSITADYKDGVLDVRVPKTAAAKARRIPIGTN